MIAVVTGMGPRTGTSSVMQYAINQGLPVTGKQFIDGYTVPKHNPQGYWESDLETIQKTNIKNTVIKLWYPALKYIDHSFISCIVVLERKNKLAQLASMYKVYRDEYQMTKINLSVLELFYEQQTKLPQWLSTRNQQTIFKVYTEDLDQEYSNIFRFLKKGLTCQ
jgi:hypothetical protein